ncbi:MAG: aspartate-semialdehyde dehydrogenase [bacterium]|nr:aspartate-semialdehyde dehydrogenase [bacterium]
MNPKIPVGILGATGSVGQKFIELLADHPWFEITAVAASENSAGKAYKDAVGWFMKKPIPERVASMIVEKCEPTLDCKIVFSGLDASVAGEIETKFRDAGYFVISNSRNHRMDPDVPLLVPEINPESLSLLEKQTSKGKIITNPNCSVMGLVFPLKTLLPYGIEAISVVTLQALSGAGYPGVASVDIIDNVIPFIGGGEEEKIETEPNKILSANLNISATVNRVAVLDGHTECISVKLKNKLPKEELINIWNNFKGEPQELDLPMAPKQPIKYFLEENFPQPKLHRDLEKGMVVSIGRLRDCSVLDYKFTILSHNTVRGAAGGAILNAELLVKKGFVK